MTWKGFDVKVLVVEQDGVSLRHPLYSEDAMAALGV